MAHLACYNRDAFASIILRESREKTIMCWQVCVICSWVSYRLQLCEREKEKYYEKQYLQRVDKSFYLAD